MCSFRLARPSAFNSADSMGITRPVVNFANAPFDRSIGPLFVRESVHNKDVLAGRFHIVHSIDGDGSLFGVGIDAIGESAYLNPKTKLRKKPSTQVARRCGLQGL